MNDLENIPYHSVINSDNLSYVEWRKKLRPNYFVVWRDIAFGYLAIGAIICFSILFHLSFPSLFLVNILISSILFGFMLAYLALFIHEAGHFNIHPDKKKNDLLANIFLGALFGIDIKSYRKIHWQHHIHLGTIADTESSYFNALTSGFLLESFTGVYLLKVMQKKNEHHLLSSQQKKDSFRMLLITAVITLLILGAGFLTKQWPFALSWAAAMLIFFPFFATLRQILEHRNEAAERTINYYQVNHGKLSRIFTSSLGSRLFGAAGFNKHMIHHWDPQISYTRLNEIELFLSECHVTKDIILTSKTSYTKTLRKLLFR